MRIFDLLTLGASLWPINMATSILPIVFCMGATNGFPQADWGLRLPLSPA
jgi:hypothetical protein